MSGLQVVHVVRGGCHDDHGDGKHRWILLVLHVAIHREHNIEPRRPREVEQSAIAHSGPTHLGCCPHVVTREQVAQSFRDAFVE